MLTGGQETTAHLWKTPQPVQDELGQILLRLQIATGMELDAEGVAHVLDAASWRVHQAQLLEIERSTGSTN